MRTLGSIEDIVHTMNQGISDHMIVLHCRVDPLWISKTVACASFA